MPNIPKTKLPDRSIMLNKTGKGLFYRVEGKGGGKKL